MKTAKAKLLIAAAFVVGRQRETAPLEQRSLHTAALPELPKHLAPTVANYEMMANQPLEKLDELLTKQGSRNLPPAPIYTASTLAPEKAQD